MNARKLDLDLRGAAEVSGALIRFENGEEAIDQMFLKGFEAERVRSERLYDALQIVAGFITDSSIQNVVNEVLEVFGVKK